MSQIDRPSYTSGQVARMLGISQRTVLNYLSSGRLGGVRNPITGTWTITRQNVIEFLVQEGLDPIEYHETVSILLVDDDQAVLRSMEALLRQFIAKANLFSCADGYQALIWLGSYLPDLVILDSRMPGVDGKEVLKAIRQTEKTAHVKVLVISGYPEDVAAFRDLGADEVLGKPIDEEQLRVKVDALLASRRKMADRRVK